MNVCDTKLNEIKSLLKSYSIELRHVEPALQKQYKDKKNDYQEKLNQFATKIKFYRGAGERDTLMAGNRGGQEKDLNKQSGEELLSGALKTQDQTMAALNRIQQAAVDSKEIGMAVGSELIRQTEQMKNISEDLNNIESELTRSNALIRAFGMKMMTDRCIQIFLFLLVAGFAAIIILSVVMPDNAVVQTFNVPDELKPPVDDIKKQLGKRYLRGPW